jgi:hypothetical protein
MSVIAPAYVAVSGLIIVYPKLLDWPACARNALIPRAEVWLVFNMVPKPRWSWRRYNYRLRGCDLRRDRVSWCHYWILRQLRYR